MTNQSPTTDQEGDPKDGTLSVGELRSELKPLLLQFIAEYHQGLNELAGHGTAIDQTSDAILALFTAATNEKLPASGDEALNPFIFSDFYPDKDLTDYNAEEAYEMGVSAGIDSRSNIINTAVAEERARLVGLLPESELLGGETNLGKKMKILGRNEVIDAMRKAIEGRE